MNEFINTIQVTNSTQTLTKDQLFQMTRLAWEPGLATTATHSSTGCERRLVIGNLSLVISYWSMFNEGWVIKTHLSLIRTILLLPLASSYKYPPPGGWHPPWSFLLANKWVFPIEFCFAWLLPPLGWPVWFWLLHSAGVWGSSGPSVSHQRDGVGQVWGAPSLVWIFQKVLQPRGTGAFL